jgi:hypothetical protein
MADKIHVVPACHLDGTNWNTDSEGPANLCLRAVEVSVRHSCTRVQDCKSSTFPSYGLECAAKETGYRPAFQPTSASIVLHGN